MFLREDFVIIVYIRYICRERERKKIKLIEKLFTVFSLLDQFTEICVQVAQLTFGESKPRGH